MMELFRENSLRLLPQTILFIYLFIYLFFIYLFIYLFIHLFVYLFIYRVNKVNRVKNS